MGVLALPGIERTGLTICGGPWVVGRAGLTMCGSPCPPGLVSLHVGLLRRWLGSRFIIGGVSDKRKDWSYGRRSPCECIGTMLRQGGLSVKEGCSYYEAVFAGEWCSRVVFIWNFEYGKAGCIISLDLQFR